MGEAETGKLWVQLADVIRHRITSGEPIPDLSDVALASAYKVSTGTVRQAVRVLASEGLLTRRRGVGTFVTAPPLRSELNAFGNFMVEWQLQGRRVSVELLERRTLAASMTIAAGLGVATGELVAYNRRRRLADGLPVAVDHRFIPLELDEGLEDSDFLHESLWRTIQERKGVDPVESRVTVRATGADEEAVDLLGLALNAPALSHELQMLDATGRIIMFGNTTYHPDRFVYSSIRTPAPRATRVAPPLQKAS